MQLGQQIRKYRGDKGLSQEELAIQVYVSRQTISNWENNKNYPDIKSLVLLSDVFGVSLDQLVKGDIEVMKQEINSEELRRFQRNSTIFTILFIATLVSLIPLYHFLGWIGCGIWGMIAILSIYYSILVEKHKKYFDIQTYKEIVAFSEGTSLSEIEKAREEGKRPYQKVFLAIGAAVLALLITVLMAMLLL